MPKFGCKCGSSINLSGVPGPHEKKLISEVEIEKLAEQLEGNFSVENLLNYLDVRSTTIYECPDCCRLYLEEKNGVFVSYCREHH